jgi:hypothetical protein
LLETVAHCSTVKLEARASNACQTTACARSSKEKKSKYKERLTTPATGATLRKHAAQNQMQGPPRFLVQTEDGALHAYYREDILRIDLAKNRPHPPKQIFRLHDHSLTVSYHPIDIKDLTIATIVSTEQAILAAAP